MRAYLHIYISLYVYIYVYIYIYTLGGAFFGFNLKAPSAIGSVNIFTAQKKRDGKRPTDSERERERA
jgi:hypothetical protein